MTTSLPNLDLALERICKNLKRLYLEKNSQDFNKNQKYKIVYGRRCTCTDGNYSDDLINSCTLSNILSCKVPEVFRQTENL